MAVISMKQLLEAGVHFGHQTRRWNPKMAPYIFTERNGIYIIDLQKTVKKVDEAYDFVRKMSAEGKDILFVGTKKQAQESIQEEAERIGMHFVNNRWLGGMLTNFQTIKSRIKRLEALHVMEEDGTMDVLPKKEVAALLAEMDKLEKNLGGIRNLNIDNLGAMFVVDPRKERIAIAEAHTLGIPIVAIVDTNCDPDEIDYIIPGNDDAIRAVKLIASKLGDAVLEGRQGEQMEIPAPKAAPVEVKPAAVVEAPKAEAPKTEAPKAEAPKAEAPKAEAPKAEAAKAEAAKATEATEVVEVVEVVEVPEVNEVVEVTEA